MFEFNNAADATLELDSIQFRENVAPNGGGFGVQDKGTVTMKVVQFNNNSATIEAAIRIDDERCVQGGGGAYMVGSDLTIDLDLVDFEGNQALVSWYLFCFFFFLFFF